MTEGLAARRARAVVCAYHNVGVRCLSVLLAGGVDVPLVLTHRDNPAEAIWFSSVAELAGRHGIRVITPDDPNAAEVIAEVAASAPDFLFSFYYRSMLAPALLAVAPRGALNMHGSLLPRYRGRVPVNWAVIRGERETGASLHYMTARPDQGDVVGRQRVPILPDDTAFEVFQKVTWAAEVLLEASLPALLAGTAPREPQDLGAGNYCGGRRPEDGRIDWRRPLAEVHNLVRGVAPPYPGAFTTLGGLPARVLRTQHAPPSAPPRGSSVPLLLASPTSGLYVVHPDGSTLRILELELDGRPADAADVLARLGTETALA
ncbi:MAG: formyltransferase [Pseudomonadota bacterium]|nr:formyltransferase [Pseudomonadota bacterium]